MPVYRRTLLVPVTFTAADDEAADRFARDLLGAACDGAEALNTAGSLEVGDVSVLGPDAARAASLAVLLVRAASACAQVSRVRVEVGTVPGEPSGDAATYVHDLAQLDGAGASWGHERAPGRDRWWAQDDAAPTADDVTRRYQRDGLETVLRDLDGGAA